MLLACAILVTAVGVSTAACVSCAISISGTSRILAASVIWVIISTSQGHG